MPRYVPTAGLQIWPQGVHAPKLEQIRFLDFRPAELLQLLQPAAQHRLDAFVYLRARARIVCDKVRFSTEIIRTDAIE